MKLAGWVLGSVVLLAGCSGGGNGGSSGDSGAVVSAARLSKSNVSDVAELLREDIRNGVGIHESLRAQYGGSLPQFVYQNIDSTYNCYVSGSVHVVVRGYGAEVDEEFNQCSDYAGTVVSGRISYKYEDVNTTANSYTLTFTSANYRVSLGNGSVYTEDGTLRLDAVLQQSSVNLTMQSRLAISRTGLSESFTTNATHTFSYERLSSPYAGQTVDLSSLSGTLDLASSGRVSLSWDGARQVGVLSGQGTERGYLLLTSNKFALEYLDSAGLVSAVGVPADAVLSLDVFSTSNTAPVLTTGVSRQVSQGAVGSLPLENWLFDAEFDVLDVVVTVVSEPANAIYSLGKLSGFSIPFVAQTLGHYTLRVHATDPSGLVAEGNITIEVAPDFDADGVANEEDLDDDNDGINDVADALPYDSAESVDTDRDGIGNNADTDDDGDGVSDAGDSYPLNALCQLPAHGENGVCRSVYIGAALAATVDDSGIMYFLDAGNRKVIRWNTASNQLLNSISLGSATPTGSAVRHMTYSSVHGRLYFGYDTGSITYVDLNDVSLTERVLITLPESVGGLIPVGNYVLAQDASGAWETHYILAKTGVITDQEDWNYYSRTYSWDPVNSRVYFFRDDTSPNDLHYEVIDQATGTISGRGETPYHDGYVIAPPIVVSEDGQRVLLGSGVIYNAAGLIWSGAVPAGIGAGSWTSVDGLVTARSSSVTTTIERRSSSLAVREQMEFAGQLKWLLRTVNGYRLVTVVDGDAKIVAYTPSDDNDGDGISNTQDDFSLDPAASRDSDHDGYPDSWNAGKGQADSTTGLALDAYPNDAACHNAGDGNGAICDYARVIPAFIPDRIVGDSAGILYLLSKENYRVYRWSAAANSYIAPLVVGNELAVNVSRPTHMEYSPAHERLYFGYANGNVTYVDLSHVNAAETNFVTMADAVGGIGIAGDRVLLQDTTGAWESHYIYSGDGQLLDSADWNYYSSTYAWNAALNRIYFFRGNSSPNDLHYEDIDPVTGEIVAKGETLYHGDYSMQAPILVSPDGSSVLLGSGDIYLAGALTWKKSLPNGFLFGAWLSSGKVVTLRSVGTGSRIDVYDASQNWVSEADINGSPRGIFELNGKVYVATEPVTGLAYTEFAVP